MLLNFFFDKINKTLLEFRFVRKRSQIVCKYQVLRLPWKPFIMYRVSWRPFIRFSVYHASYPIVLVSYPIVRLSYTIVLVSYPFVLVFYPIVRLSYTIVLVSYPIERVSYPNFYHVRNNVAGTVDWLAFYALPAVV